MHLHLDFAAFVIDAILSKPDPMTDERSNCTNRFVSVLNASIM